MAVSKKDISWFDCDARCEDVSWFDDWTCPYLEYLECVPFD